MEEDLKTEAGAVADLVTASQAVKEAAGGAKPFVIVPEGYDVRDIEAHLLAPTRRSGTIIVRDAASFIAVVNKFKGEATTIYRQVRPTPEFTAVFNDDTASTTGWGDHRAHYACPISTEWQAWTQASGKPMTQSDFALFVEKNLPDLVTADTGTPTPAQMLEISRTLQAKKKVNFASGTRLDNGEIQFRYEEQIEGTAGKGDIKVPEAFKLGIPVFEGGDLYAVQARLRYRIGERGELAMWFDLERPHKIVEDAVAEIAKLIEAEVGMKSINGSR